MIKQQQCIQDACVGCARWTEIYKKKYTSKKLIQTLVKLLNYNYQSK
jgi:hypothetical protein